MAKQGSESHCSTWNILTEHPTRELFHVEHSYPILIWDDSNLELA
jgi:hypothetical protein